jgi:4'-phosphopantetheinyl transferase
MNPNDAAPTRISLPNDPAGLCAAPALHVSDVHVWSVRLCREPPAVEALFRILSRDERQRAEEYVFERDRSRFIQARGELRMILGGYLGVRADRIRFRYDEFGKPWLGGPDGDRLGFNLTHSHGMALVAVARGRRVGIDIEYVDEHRPYLDIAECCFSPLEANGLRQLPPDLRPAAFFNCWTRKEAYIKALGTGLSYPLREFTVPIISAGSDTLLAIDDPLESRPWSLVSLPAYPGYSAALVTEGEAGCAVRFYSLEEIEDESGGA